MMKKITLFLPKFFLLFMAIPGISQDAEYVLQIDKNFKSAYIQNWLVAGEFPSEFLPADHHGQANRAGYNIDFLKEILVDVQPDSRSPTQER